MQRVLLRACIIVVVLLGGGLVGPASAQYFGQNKVQYDNFDFQKFDTDHFSIYFYPEERDAVMDAGRMAERWYERHSRTFLRGFQERKPLIFYANSADFQQTNAVRSRLSQGTGGVTESIKERVIMPLTGSYKETDHVLGHELVHSFQYDIALNGNNRNFSLRNMPLWLVEGMAEYLSVGNRDPHTAMWLRDAIQRDDLPTIRQMTRKQREYFPYRYGQAYMSYVGGKYGDAAVTDLYKMGGRVGLDSAFVYSMGITPDSLSKEWKQSVRSTYEPKMDGRTPVDSVGTAIVGTPGKKNQLNISPSVSPNGDHVAFISRQSIFNTNLFIADAETGEIVQELQGTRSNPHFDNLRFIDAAGSWSPEGDRFAFVTFANGTNEINILDVETGKTQSRTAVKGVGSINNVAWSPEGHYIAFSGLDGGISDLYLYDLEKQTVRQLTDDRYAALQPTWSPDGSTIAFTTDRGVEGTDFRNLEYGAYRIGLIDIKPQEPPIASASEEETDDAALGSSEYTPPTPTGIRTVRPFSQGMHHNPQFSPDGNSIYFISDHDGFKDVYRHNLEDGTTYRITNLTTGVSGVTATSPALSVARESGDMMLTVFANSGYSIVSLPKEKTKGTVVSPSVSDSTTHVAGRLPPVQSTGLVSSYLDDPLTGLSELKNVETSEASNRLQLDRVAPPSVGASVGGTFGTQVSGGVGFAFSDILGNQKLNLTVQANGTLRDIGGGVIYRNQENRIDYGVGASHIPSAFGQIRVLESGDFVRVVQRLFQTRVFTQTSYPLSKRNRFELSAGGTRYGFGINARDQSGNEIDTGRIQNLESLPDPLYLGQVGLAYIGDFSSSGLTSPLQGGRYRFQVTPQFGSRNFVSVLADYRRYLRREPFTFAVRGLHSGNYGGEFTGEFTDLFLRESIAEPFQTGFVRGYSRSSILGEDRCRIENECKLSDLYGSRMATGSLEIRLPLLGPEILGVATFKYIPTELVLFGDAGVTWTREDLSDFSFYNDASGLDDIGENNRLSARPITSAGVSARVNVLGAAVLELFYARTFQRARPWDFGVLLRPGW